MRFVLDIKPHFKQTSALKTTFLFKLQKNLFDILLIINIYIYTYTNTYLNIMDYIKKLFIGGYDELWKAVIRPPRDEYNETELGPDTFSIKGKHFKRNDFYIYNSKGLKLYCSHWEPINEQRTTLKMNCVIYLHGNCSSRTEALSEAKFVLLNNMTLFSFDFSGCGKSEGKYITLGIKEQYDIESVVYYLYKSETVSSISLWGRSMGSIAAFLFCKTFKNYKNVFISSIIADSPFIDLTILLKELATEKLGNIVMFSKLFNNDSFIDKILDMIDDKVFAEAGFRLSEINAANCIENIKDISIYFISGRSDDFVKIHHSHYLYSIYKYNKSFLSFDGDHNTVRPKHIRLEVINFINKVFKQRVNDYKLNNLLETKIFEEFKNNYIRKCNINYGNFSDYDTDDKEELKKSDIIKEENKIINKSTKTNINYLNIEKKKTLTNCLSNKLDCNNSNNNLNTNTIDINKINNYEIDIKADLKNNNILTNKENNFLLEENDKINLEKNKKAICNKLYELSNNLKKL